LPSNENKLHALPLHDARATCGTAPNATDVTSTNATLRVTVSLPL
jgi:hypothetical protein